MRIYPNEFRDMILFVIALSSIWSIDYVLRGHYYLALVFLVFVVWGLHLLYKNREEFMMKWTEWWLQDREAEKERKLEGLNEYESTL